MQQLASGNPPSSWKSLPDELVAHVLSFIATPQTLSVSRVSRRVHAEFLALLFDSDTLDLRWCLGETQLADAARFVCARAGQFKRVQRLLLEGQKVPGVLDVLCATFGAQLTQLSIDSRRLSEADLVAVLPSLEHLEELQLSGSARLGDQVTRCVARHCSRLRVFEASRCPRMSNLVLELSQACPQLTTLRFDQCIHVGNPAVRAFSNLQHLESINLSRCIQLTDDGLADLGRHAALQSVSLTSCFRLSGAGIAAMLDNLIPHQSLHTLRLGGVAAVGDQVMQSLSLAATSSLQHLAISGCRSLTRAGLDVLPLFTQLESLYVDKLDALDDAILTRIALNCPLLTDLSILQCDLVTDAGVSSLSALSGTLQRLRLGFNFELTDAAIDGLFRDTDGSVRKTPMKYLDLRLMNRLTVPAFELIAVACPALQSIRIGGVATEPVTRQISHALHAQIPACHITI